MDKLYKGLLVKITYLCAFENYKCTIFKTEGVQKCEYKPNCNG